LGFVFPKIGGFYTDRSLERFPTEPFLLHGDIGTVQGHKPILDERFLSGPTQDKSGPLLDDWRQFSIVIQGDNGIEVAEQWIA
jgi:hypothetical protein